MEPRTYHPPSPRGELSISVVLGAAAAFVLFVLMAIAQMIGDVRAPSKTIEETVVAYQAPEVTPVEEEAPPPPEEEKPQPELDREPPQLSLSQLDIALNPGTGGSLVGDFAMPTIATSAHDLGTEDFVDFSDLDQMPRPVAGTTLDFPTRLKRKKVTGRVVVLVKLNEEGRVLEVTVDSSTLPEFDDVVADQVGSWHFTPPTQQGRPVKAKARLPIPIRIQ